MANLLIKSPNVSFEGKKNLSQNPEHSLQNKKLGFWVRLAGRGSEQSESWQKVAWDDQLHVALPYARWLSNARNNHLQLNQDNYLCFEASILFLHNSS